MAGAENNARLRELEEALKTAGYRMTPQRRAILSILAQDRSHPSIDDIYQRVKADFPMTSLATVYKTVTLLHTMGQVMAVGSTDDYAHYDGRGPAPHPHLICVCCGSIADVDVAGLDQIIAQVARKSGYTMQQERADFWGLCPACQQARTMQEAAASGA